MPHQSDLRVQARYFRQWLASDAYPLWWNTGADRSNGGFYEKLTQAGQPTHGARRTRVVGRQIFSYANAVNLACHDEASEAVRHGLDFLLVKSRSKEGFFYASVSPDGTPVRPDFDLYDHAFALFGLASAAQIGHAPDELADVSVAVLKRMLDSHAHPAGGFYEGHPRKPPLMANPHMHIFEACLEWCAVAERFPELHLRCAPWRNQADAIGELALRSFIDRQGGQLYEFYGLDWTPLTAAEGQIVEPGHQYEWAWLMLRWGQMRNRQDAIDAAFRLIDLAETHGVDRARSLAINELWPDLTPKDTAFRLWPQTERLKAHLLAADVAATETARQAHQAAALDACIGLDRFLTAAARGLWVDRLDHQGEPLWDDAPASSFYHIVCGLRELIHRFG